MKIVPIFLLCLLQLLSCQYQDAVAPPIQASDLDEILSEFTSDDFMGRKPFTEGEKITIEYLENELKKIGVAPGNGDSYFQDVPLVETTGMPEETMTISTNAENLVWNLNEDFVTYTEREEETIKIEDSEIIFCGFGITAPEHNWNDFAGIDVKGKTIVVLVNDPGFGSEDDNFFKGNTMTYYGRWTYKYEEAARQGAEAVIIIHETTSAGYPWFVVSSSWTGSKLNLQSEDKGMSKCAIQGWIHLDAAKQLFKRAGKDLGEEIRKARTPDFKPYSLEMYMSHTLKNTFKYDVSKNVIGIIKGSKRPDETIIYSAHWDHFGVGQPVEGDSIYNGALDNGTGTACVLSIAKSFASGPQPERSIVFLFVTAEEQGLLGSAYYAAHPIYSVENTVANLNLDGMNIYGPMKYLTITGIGHSEMDDYATEAAKAQGREILPDQEPEKGYFFRSDHFNFAKVGIPALYAQGDYEHLEKGIEYVEEKKQFYLSKQYHQPADEYDPETWDLRGLVEDAQLFFNVGTRLANESYFPKWKEGSEFKSIREAQIHKN